MAEFGPPELSDTEVARVCAVDAEVIGIMRDPESIVALSGLVQTHRNEVYARLFEYFTDKGNPLPAEVEPDLRPHLTFTRQYIARTNADLDVVNHLWDTA